MVVFKASMLNSPGGVHLPKYVHLPSILYQYSRHICSIHQGVHLPKYVCLPSIVYWYSRHLCSIWGVHLPKCVHLPSVVYWHSRHLCSIQGGPSAKVGSSAKFGVVVFKASILNSLGGSIGQSRFICQVWCSSIQGIYA